MSVNASANINYTCLVKFDELITAQAMTEDEGISAMDKYLKNCVDINSQNLREETALHDGIRDRKVRVIKTLHRAGADWTIEDFRAETPKDSCCIV